VINVDHEKEAKNADARHDFLKSTIANHVKNGKQHHDKLEKKENAHEKHHS